MNTLRKQIFNMKNIGILTVMLLFFLTCGSIAAQQNSDELNLSLKEAQELCDQE